MPDPLHFSGRSRYKYHESLRVGLSVSFGKNILDTAEPFIYQQATV